MRSPVIAAEIAVCRVDALRFCKSVLGAEVLSRVRVLARVLSNRAQLSKKCGAAA
jgi:hypothetical protein